MLSYSTTILVLKRETRPCEDEISSSVARVSAGYAISIGTCHLGALSLHQHHHRETLSPSANRCLSRNYKCRLNATPRRLRPGRTFYFEFRSSPLTLMDDGWTEVREWATPRPTGEQGSTDPLYRYSF